jgi:hypothetical protein
VLKSGVKFAAASDMCWFYAEKTRGRYGHDVFRIAQCWNAVTRHHSRGHDKRCKLLGWQTAWAVEPGNLLTSATAGDPVADLSELERVGFVMNDGKVVRNTLPRVKAPALAAERPSAPRTPREGERLAQPILSMHEREIQAG